MTEKLEQLIDKEQISTDEIINFVQKERLIMLLGLEDLKIKQTLLSDLSFTALHDKRIQTDDKNSIEDRKILSVINEVLKDMPSNPFKNNNINVSIPNVNIETITPQIGELIIGKEEITYEEIMLKK